MVMSSEEVGKWCGLVDISHGQRNVVVLRQVVVPFVRQHRECHIFNKITLGYM